MAWWKFWTWGRGDNAAGSDRTQKDAWGSNSAPHDPDDILISISGLIDGQQDELADFIRTTRTAEISVVIDDVPISDGGTKSTDTIAGTQTTELAGTPSVKDAAPVSQPVQAKPKAPEKVSPGITARPHELFGAAAVDPSPESKAREARALNREIARKDPRKTLVAEDGIWPTIKGLSESFGELDNADGDSDDFGGPSPFQTMVPKDD